MIAIFILQILIALVLTVVTVIDIIQKKYEIIYAQIICVLIQYGCIAYVFFSI